MYRGIDEKLNLLGSSSSLSLSKALKLRCCEEENFIDETIGSGAMSERLRGKKKAPTVPKNGDIYMN